MTPNVGSRSFGVAAILALTLALSSDALAGQGKAAPSGFAQAAAPAVRVTGHGGFVQPYFFPSFGFGWGYFSPFVEIPHLPPAIPYLPKFWWAEPYPSADPRQAGYNPNGGYPKEEVTTLLLATSPAKARVYLDGVFVGTNDYLGPIQLPLGEHTLRVEARGYETSETVLRIEQPTLQQLEVRLTPSAPPAADAEARR